MEQLRKGQNQVGQTILEYILLLAVATSVVLLINQGFRNIRNGLWMRIVCEVSAACPGCPPPPDIKSRGNALAPGACPD